MRLDNQTTDVEVYGDIKENKVSIDPRNLQHIITILSSNLYSNPEESFLRETISNAIDSHLEAGSNEPVMLIFRNNEADSNYTIAIRDYGTGISPERFQEIYLNIGSSTKRDSNEYIGAFGIGRFSCLAASDTAYITSFYNGKEYQYIMLKNNGTINIDLLCTKDTQEHNGLEVKIVVDSITKYLSSLYALSFFPSLYIHAEGFTSMAITNFKNKELDVYNTFRTCKSLLYKEGYNYYSAYYLTLGNVIYKYRIDHDGVSKIVNSYLQSKYHNTAYLYGARYILDKIVLKFNIGDLDVTPNRESILYSQKTIEALSNKIIEALQEIESMVNTYDNKEIKDIKELFFFHEDSDDFIINDYTKIQLPRDWFVRNKLYRNKPSSEYFKVFCSAFRYRNLQIDDVSLYSPLLAKCTYKQCSSIEVTEIFRNKSYHIKGFNKVKIIIVKGYKNTISGSNCYCYLRSKTYSGTYTLIIDGKKSIRDYVNDLIKAGDPYGVDKNKYRELAFDIVKYFYKNAEILDLENDEDYKQYVIDYKANRKNKDKKVVEKTDFRYRLYGNVHSSLLYTNTQDFIKSVEDYIKTCVRYSWRSCGKVGVRLYAYNDDPLINVGLALPEYCTIAVLPKKVKGLIDFPKSWKPIEEVININNKIISRDFAYKKFIKPLYNLKLMPLFNYIPYKEELKEILYHNEIVYCSCREVINKWWEEYEKNTSLYDTNYRTAIEKITHLFEQFNKLKTITEFISGNMAFIAYLGMKNKLFRIDMNTYLKVKNNFKLDKNESN